MQKVVRWHPPSFDIRVESCAIPSVEHPDDAIVKVTLSGLCGSDLHIYRGHGGVNEPIVMGHEFTGEVVALGASYHPGAVGRPRLYATLKVGHRIISPFTVSCGECHFCRVGFTCRCPFGGLFGSPKLPGGQAQYVRVPRAGGTLFSLDDAESWSFAISGSNKPKSSLSGISDASLLLLADILPTGVFAALQALNHPKVLPMATGKPYPYSFFHGEDVHSNSEVELRPSDMVLTFAVIGLGPVGVCACVSLLDMLASRNLPFKVIAIDPLESRREKMKAVYKAIDESGKGVGEFVVESIEGSKDIVHQWTDGIGCTSVLEVVGNNSALTLAYDLVRAFGSIISVGVHGEPAVPFQGRDLYNKNISFDFGRCPARAMFPLAFNLLVKRQDVFGGVGEEASLIDRIVGFDAAVESYAAFNEGKCGKILFDPWK